MRIFLALLAMGSTSGCASIIDDYEEARQAALADPGPVPQGWEPDAVLHLSLPLLDTVVQASLEDLGALDGVHRVAAPLGLSIELRPSLQVDSLKLVRSQTCADCLTVMADLSGSVGVDPLPTASLLDIRASTTFDVRFSSAQQGSRWTVGVRPTEVKKLDLELGEVVASLGSVDDALASWARDQLLSAVPEVVLTEIDTSALPLRALRVQPSSQGLSIEMLTLSPTPTALGGRNQLPAKGWSFELSADSLVDLVRAESFAAGPLDYDIVVDPTALQLDRHKFSLDLRLWRVKGRGWWRDYEIQGEIEPSGEQLDLQPTTVDEVDQSAGAVVVDPLAALAEGRILEVIEQTLATSLPASQEASFSGLAASLGLLQVRGKDGVISLAGELELGEAAQPAPPQRPARERSRPPRR